MRAARCASWGVMPERRFSSIKSCRCERTSRSRSCSTRRFKKRLRRKLLAFVRTGILHLYGYGLRRLQGLSDGPGNSAPALRFGFELLPSCLGQAVVFRVAIVFGISPKGGSPTFFFHAVQSGKEGARFDHKGATGDLLDSAGDA